MISSNNNIDEFLGDIEALCAEKSMDYIDAVVFWCEQNRVEIEYIAALIKKDPVFKLKLQVEAENLNILKRGARLPV